MSGFKLGGALGRRLHEALGARPEQRDAETDRATREARHRHETRLEERRSEFDRLRSDVEQFPEFVLDLQAGEAMFTHVYRALSLPFMNEFVTYGLTAPAHRLHEAIERVGIPGMREVVDWHVRVKPAKQGRSDMPWDYVQLKSKLQPEVYTIDRQTMENQPGDLDWLIRQLSHLEVRNRPKDHVFEGKRLKVHVRLYAYWSGSLSFDRQGVALGLKRVGIYTGRGVDVPG